MKFSIIMPVYNASNSLENSIKSILKQTYNNFELILINDGSDDNSGFLCDNYSESYSFVKTFHLKNSGVSIARNKGIVEAGGDYCLFIDSDDFLESNALMKIHELLSKKTIDFLIFGYYHDNIQNGIIDNVRMTKVPKIKDNANAHFYNNYKTYDSEGLTYPVWNKVYNLNFIKNNDIKFPPRVAPSQDFIFNLLVYEKAEYILLLSDHLYHYISYGENSITTTFKQSKIDSVFYVYRTARKIMERWNKDNLNLIENEFLKNVSVYVNSMYNPECNLTTNEKKYIINKIINNSECKGCLKRVNPVGLRNKILFLLLKYNLINLLLVTGKLSRSKLINLMN